MLKLPSSELINESEEYEVEEILENNVEKMNCDIRLNEQTTSQSTISESLSKILMTHQSYMRHIMSESRKEAKESQGERSKNTVKMKVKSHYCTHIEQLKPKITFKE
jgi:hypothetical protein